VGGLTVTRRMGERVVMDLPDGRCVVVSVFECPRHADRVRLHVDAPDDVLISRPEAGGVRCG
jgi:sRNA-binding carbon storage regulator CsrA